ncbi:acetoacetyl-CoA synthetase [Lentinula edodes]|uniref:acetoacetyl-CoA synthetase n=1 Tax=Lentinula edodes TaxID=5353 RepID=UPI001E8EC4BF|nr:acetoacetyl-CoA synthetase [Lentinula edodes]KAH7876567.1 acetoacetyl-CoA synthetase [Lentinula edodes]
MASYFDSSRILWENPQPQFTNVEIFRRMVNRKRGLNLKDYHEFHKYSIENYSFWEDAWQHLRIIYSVPPQNVITEGPIPNVPIWFPGARLNYAENLLWRNDDSIACTAGGESGKVTQCTFRELRLKVQSTASAMRANGLQIGDRVAAVVTNSIEAVTLALATASIGGIYSSTATDMGTQGILDRYHQIQPKFVFLETEVMYAGKTVDLRDKVSAVVKGLHEHGLKCAIVLPSAITGKEIEVGGVQNTITLSKFLASGTGNELIFEQLSFNHPLYILYSSGTSGPPKCIVHSAGGVLMQTLKDQRMIFDMKDTDTLFQFTTTGWMMWNFMVSSLASGCRMILYDGSPFHPTLEAYLKFISDAGVTLWGTSPRFLAEVKGRKISPLKIGSFEGLRTLAVTGAVVTPPIFEWSQEAFGGKFLFVSTSGGTDVCCAFVGGVPSLPVHVGEIQHKALGMAVEVFDEDGKNIEHTGQAGELVCTRPHPSLPVMFWGDTPSGKKLRDTYFNFYPGIWRQGDFMVVNPKTKGIMVLGRSDGVLNPNGVRFGSGEIYTVMENFNTIIEDCICVGQRRPNIDEHERVLLFLKMRAGNKFTTSLEREIKSSIRTALSARHVPSYIFEVEDIPVTINGKKIEIAVKQIVSGSTLKPSGTVANPESLKLYFKYKNIEEIAETDKVGVKSRL